MAEFSTAKVQRIFRNPARLGAAVARRFVRPSLFRRLFFDAGMTEGQLVKHLALLAVVAAMPAFAHHGWSGYDASQPLEVVGTIEESGYVHPHGFARIKAADKSWTVILAPPSRMQNRGLDKDMLAVGRRVTAYGFPNRNNPGKLRAERITIDQKTTELR